MSYPDLYNVEFWWVVGLALIVLVPLADARARKWALAAINLSIFALMLKGGLLVVLGMAAGAWLLLGACAIGSRAGGAGPAAPGLVARYLPRLAMAGGGLVVLGLFVINKLPALGASAGLGRLAPVLSAMGFSYVALRWLDAARVLRDGGRRAPDLAATINYLLPFHMLAAGPIQSYDEFTAQPPVPAPLTRWAALRAIERISLGLFKKYVLAQALERLFLTGFHSQGAYVLLEVQLIYLWLYLDFSAYSDVAVGLGRLIGVATPENFNRPYLARNVIDFWERWHISLSMFIRRNVFIPMQLAGMRATGGRAPLWIASAAFVVAFLLCGLWHSIGWVWAAWGLYQAIGLIICNLYRHFLTRRLGRKGVLSYMANGRIRLVAMLLTFEFAAFGVAIVTYPFPELFSWTSY